MDSGVSDARSKLAAELGESHSDVLIRAWNQEGYLHDQHDQIAEYDAAENHQKPSNVAKRWSRFQDSVFSLEKHF